MKVYTRFYYKNSKKSSKYTGVAYKSCIMFKTSSTKWEKSIGFFLLLNERGIDQRRSELGEIGGWRDQVDQQNVQCGVVELDLEHDQRHLRATGQPDRPGGHRLWSHWLHRHGHERNGAKDRANVAAAARTRTHRLPGSLLQPTARHVRRRTKLTGGRHHHWHRCPEILSGNY